MERRFVMRERCDGDAVEDTITFSELRHRFIEATQTIRINPDTGDMYNWHEVLPVLLHGEKEQEAEPDSWDEWVESMPPLGREGVNDIYLVKDWLRACPCRK